MSTTTPQKFEFQAEIAQQQDQQRGGRGTVDIVIAENRDPLAGLHRIGQAFGMQVIAWSQNLTADVAAQAGATHGGKHALFAKSDIVSVHLVLSGRTRGIVGAEDLARMKPTALIVNTSRAELIAPGALLAALRAGRPGYAAVDVYEQEPIVNGDHPFLSMPNVVCTPHLGWAEWDNFDLYYSEAFDQIVAYANGQPMRLANPDVLGKARLPPA